MELIDSSRFLWTNTSAKNSNYINLVQVGWSKCLPNSSYSHYRDIYIIHIIKNGVGTIETGGHRYTLGKNEAFLVRPNELTVQTADSENPWELYYFSFTGKFAEEILRKTNFQGVGFYSPVTDDSVCETISQIALDLTEHPEQEIRALEYLFKMLSFFDKANTPTQSRKINNDFVYQKYISAVQEYIQLNFAKQIKISELATKLGLSRSHLYRVFL